MLDGLANTSRSRFGGTEEIVIVHAISCEEVRETVSVTLFNRQGKPVQEQWEVHRIVPI
jgi:hypothetical protein